MSSILPISSSHHFRNVAVVLISSLVILACGGENATTSYAPLETFETADFDARLAASDRPVVVNVWGSWCLPCRSEAPLLVAAHEQYANQIDFVGVAVNDTQAGAADFIEEFGIPYENLFDRNADVRSQLGGIGAPITYFVAPGGELVDTHLGIIDGQQLAVRIDELLAQS